MCRGKPIVSTLPRISMTIYGKNYFQTLSIQCADDILVTLTVANPAGRSQEEYLSLIGLCHTPPLTIWSSQYCQLSYTRYVKAFLLPCPANPILHHDLWATLPLLVHCTWQHRVVGWIMNGQLAEELVKKKILIIINIQGKILAALGLISFFNVWLVGHI